MRRGFAILSALVLIVGLGQSAFSDPPATISLTSSAFQDGDPLPVKYTADGQNVSVPLSWSNLPPKTAALALIMEDTDAPGSAPFGHWVLVNLPPAMDGLKEGVADLPAGAVQGRNDF